MNLLWVKFEKGLLQDPRLKQFRQSELLKLLGAYLVAKLLIVGHFDGKVNMQMLRVTLHKFGGYKMCDKLLDAGFLSIDEMGYLHIVEPENSTYTQAPIQASIHTPIHTPIQAPDLFKKEEIRKDKNYTNNPLLLPSLPNSLKNVEIPKKYLRFQEFPWFPIVMEIALPGKEMIWRQDACSKLDGYEMALYEHWEFFMVFFMKHLDSVSARVPDLNDAKKYVINLLTKKGPSEDIKKKLKELEDNG